MKEIVTQEASLCLYGDKLLPQEITKVMGLSPSYQQTKGEQWPIRGHLRTAQTGHWIYCSKGNYPGDDLKGHIDFLLSLIPKRIGRLIDLPNVETAKITCFHIVTGAGQDFILDLETLQECCDKGLEIHLDSYSLEESDLG